MFENFPGFVLVLPKLFVFFGDITSSQHERCGGGPGFGAPTYDGPGEQGKPRGDMWADVVYIECYPFKRYLVDIWYISIQYNIYICVCWYDRVCTISIYVCIHFDINSVYSRYISTSCFLKDNSGLK
jgi:hypothetical protein